MKKLLLIIACIAGFFWAYSTFAAETIRFDCKGSDCFADGVHDAGNVIKATGVETTKSIAEAVQDFVVYLLSFLSLVAVIYVMYAGAQLMLNPADEESAAKAKKIIIGVITGIVIIWFSWWIVSMIFYVIDKGTKTTFIPRALAETQIRNIDFTTYSNEIRALETKIDAGYSTEVMSNLSMLVDAAYDHLPDRQELYKNKQLYDAVKKAITDYNLHQEIIDRGILQSTLREFLEQSKVYMIKSQPEATPQTGDAPLSVTFEAKQTIDESGTIVPNDNYIWWLRTEGGAKKTIGKGNIINYTFNTSGTYVVSLTVNSASRNSQGLVDVVNFEDSVVVEVGQPKINFVVRINDQIADKVVKISTKEALKPIRIDASETRFASGYTIKTTEWDFGNENSDTNEGNPQFESHMYTPGEHTIQLRLIRNDGEEFSHSVVLKIGDPLASISTSNQTPNKGENVIFQAKKSSNELDVKYVWEVKKQGSESIIYTFSGTRLEYAFGDTGRYFVTLTSLKGDARDKDTLEVNIDSRPPNVQFTSEMLSSEMPNVFLFDASNSFDPDYPDNQKLRFEWFVNDEPIQLTETNARNNRGKYTFPEKATYRVSLRVTDDEGKSKELKKDIKVSSILSVKLDIRPVVVKRDDKVLLLVTAPRATSYEWKVGSNDPVRTENNRFVTSFPVSGTFVVSVTVTDADGDINTATGKLYVQENDVPFAIIDIKSDSPLSIAGKSICSGQEAITVDRANSVSFSSDKSVNKDGKNSDLTYFWRLGLNKTSTQKNATYTFDELGCEEIILTVSDKITGASSTTKTWIKVVNLTPIYNDIQVTVANLDADPMKIDLKITGAKDPDGIIRSYTWYYYTDKDDQPQGFRITRVPEASFVLPKITGRYYFAVLMEDSNGVKINTKEISDVFYSTPDLYVNTHLSTPIIEKFQADTAEVKFGDVTRFSLEVHTPVSTNVADKSEYRWDIDGDGFYDVKTSTPYYEFKYVYPGEYHPKVKVTHKGISATKSLTIVVKNALLPKASIQMIGNKIVAYNISSGIFQSTNWYLDDKKISENREYLISEIAGSGPHNLKLEISDGKITEFVTYPLQASLKNKVLLKKITRPLVIFSSLNGNDAVEVPDEIVWENPIIPLYLYTGESRGGVRYYVIDTDVDVDTDLSGGKDDDADNKGTASYKSGRPFQIPKGNKRVTIMKIRIIGNNDQDLDTRQIRIIRTFLANTEPDIFKDPEKPQTFNLSQEDKDRIERLRNLIQTAPDEEKDQFNKILDQLGDNWYDVSERIQTLNLFSNRVNESTTLSADLKKTILEQISIVYTQGDDEIEEKQLALKMITEYLDKSTKKVQIFGDDSKPGLISEIIDNPEYYEENLKVIEKIMEEYVNTDMTLTDEVKKDIKEKLMILAGTPPAISETTTAEKDSKNQPHLLFWILGGIICIILGVVSMIYVRQKLTTQHTEKEGISGEKEPTENTSPSIIDATTVQETPTPDWLKEDASPFGDEDVFSPDSASSLDTHQPDWLQETPVVPVDTSLSIETEKEQIIVENEPVSSATTLQNESFPAIDTDAIPDWLQSPPETLMETPTDIASPPSSLIFGEEKNDIATTDTTQSLDVQVGLVTETQETSSLEKVPSEDEAQQDDIPDWLRGAETAPEIDNSFTMNEDDFINDESVPVDKEVSYDDTVSSVKEEVPKNDGKKSKIETIKELKEELLESPTHLLKGVEDILIAPPKKATKIKKKATTSTARAAQNDHLLTSEHDMLISPYVSDTSL